ncbi:YncE family protein [Stigmatella aurantiaca]|uniref:Collagen triple helix repeat domain protein, putative n=1 Tax=Stigmatella aurantiaca (strain DW4/3-1) TaxID=378806 RepID=Q096R0_STIAD|nr:YncE family protein [Stigmatella aurantiaca]ADO68564.1 conserved uncharacterized protein [Stigmatella aurantiaca DW4/3-1]EAU67736.1 collagen triple helix repeat domain protein, putative [Stigmatella aurantiaca DW4/3-1]
MSRFHWRWALVAPLLLTACQENDASDPLEIPELEYGPGTPWPSPGRIPPPGPLGRILITNSKEDTVSLLDLDTLGTANWGELTRVPVGLNPVELEGPHHSAASPDGAFYYVGISNYVEGGSGEGPHGSHGTGTADGYSLKMDALTHQLVGSVRVDRNPGDLLLSPDGRTLYQTHFDVLRISEVFQRGGSEQEMEARLAILDTQTLSRQAMVAVCPAPHAVRLAPDGRRLYIACYSDEVAIVDLVAPNHPVTRVKVSSNAGSAIAPRHEPYAITVSPTTGGVWVSSLRSRSVQYLDPVTLTMDPDRTVFLGGPPLFGAFTADGHTLYMPYQRGDALAIVDPATGSVLREIPLAPSGCLNAHQVELLPDGTHGLVVCEGDHEGPGTLHLVDLKEEKVLKTVEVGIFPDSVTLLRGKP